MMREQGVRQKPRAGRNTVNKYEAMIIFPDDHKEEQIENALDVISREVEKLKGTVEGATRLGRKPFAREIKKETNGQYAVIRFEMDGSSVASLRNALKFSEDIFRIEIYRAVEAAPAAAAADAE